MIRPDLSYRYPNTGVRWTSAEIELLRALAGAGTDWREVGLKFGRTGEACRTKAAEAGIIAARSHRRSPPRRRLGAACILS